MDHAAGADQRGPPAVLSRLEAMVAADTVVISGLPPKRRVGGAKAAPALNYPHILTIYEVVRSDDEAAIALELADGEARIRLLTLTGREPGITEKTVTLAGLHYLNGFVWAADGRGW